MKIFLLIISFVFCWSNAIGQKKHNLSLFVYSEMGESVVNCHILIDEELRKISNQFGFMSTELPEGSHKLMISHISFQNKEFRFSLNQDTTLTVFLDPNSIGVVDIVAKNKNRIDQLEEINIENFNEISGITGTPDVLNTLTLLPGISAGKEGELGFSVRGGESYQNTILLDRSLLLNPNHLFGVLSTINAKVVNDVKLYKNHIPAKYGNTGASIVDINVKNGNNDSLKYDIDIGITNSSFLAEGPISKNVTFLAGGRAAYLGVLLSPAYFRYLAGKIESYANYNFYDYNLKLKYSSSSANRLTFHVYRSRDGFISKGKVEDQSRGTRQYGWENQSYNISHYKLFKKGLFWNNYISYSHYRNKLLTKLEENLSSENPDFKSSARESQYKTTTVQSQISKAIGKKHLLRLGVNVDFIRFTPILLTSIENKTENTFAPIEFGLTNSAFYIDNDYQILANLKFNYGARWNYYASENLKMGVLEPRLSLRQQFTKDLFLEASYNKLSQNRIQFSLKNFTFPLELNIPIKGQVRPPITHQLSLSLAKNDIYFKNSNIVVSAYYKEIKSLTTIEKVVPFTNNFDENYEDYLSFDGSGKSYGLEASFSFSNSHHSITTNYHLSRSLRKFGSINNGTWYAHELDRPHELSLVYNYRPNQKYLFFLNFTLNSGTPTSLPTGVVNVGEEVNLYFFEERNNYRLPIYHRADIAITRNFKTKFDRDARFTFALYNAYYHKNAYDVVVYKDKSKGGYAIKKLSVFPIIPSFNLGIKF